MKIDGTEPPYNQKNKVLDFDTLNSFLTQYDVHIPPNDINLYRKAFVHNSYLVKKNDNCVNGNLSCPGNCIPLQEESSERLEFLGDSFLGCVVANYLFERYPDSAEGFLTRMRTKLVNGKMLAHLSKSIGLQRWIMISKQIEDTDGRNSTNILEDCFEAFIGAITTDFGGESDGFKYASKWIISVIENNIDFSELVRNETNYKDMVLKAIQQSHGYIPKFYEMPSDNKTYTYCMKDNENNIISIGKGPSRKEAENNAAFNALKQIKL